MKESVGVCSALSDSVWGAGAALSVSEQRSLSLIELWQLMPKREVTSAPWVPVPARAYTGKAPRARQHRAVGRLSAGAPRLHKSCRWRRPQSKGRSCVSGRARRDLRVRGGRGHLRERPGWPSGAPISRGSTVSMIAFGGRRGPHRSGSRCRGRPIERREAGLEGCLWPNAASQGRPPDGSGG